MGSMQSLQMSRRNERSFSSEVENNGRGNMRGGSRGRGRGGGGRGGPRHSESRYNSSGTTISDYVFNIDRKPSSASSGRGRSISNGRPLRGRPPQPGSTTDRK